MRKEIRETLDRISVLTHSSIRLRDGADGSVIYVDPYEVAEATHDADVIFFTHSHYDHFSPEDVRKLKQKDTVYVMPESMKEDAAREGIPTSRIHFIAPGKSAEVSGVPFLAVPAYNTNKQFHPQANGWVGYLLSLDGVRVFVAGDTDANPENRKVRCDIAMVPAGGTYTFTAKEAAAFVNEIKPEATIPTHYGTVAGTPEDGEVFRAAVDDGIDVELKLFQESETGGIYNGK